MLKCVRYPFPDMRNGSSSYSFDQIGNRTTVSVPEEPNPISYTVNALNQYSAIAGNTPSYDDDGNMLSSGSGKSHTWTGENRLDVFTQGDITVENTYDGQGRRVRKLVKDLGVVTSDVRYMYDGWNLLYEIDVHAVSTPSRRYVWGHDLNGNAGSPRLGVGAGGVGGLLFTEADSASHAVTYDANGNISEYIDLATGNITAHLEYDAFGRTIASTGTAPAPFGFSTKYQDAESAYYYYGFRYYDPETGRWPNRDPIEEQGGVNLYGFVGNSGVNGIDVLGLSRGGSSEYIGWEWYDRAPNFRGQISTSGIRPWPWGGYNAVYYGDGMADAVVDLYDFYATRGWTGIGLMNHRITGPASERDSVDVSPSIFGDSFFDHVNRRAVKESIFRRIMLDVHAIWAERGNRDGGFGFHGGRKNVLTTAHVGSPLRLALQRFRMSFEYWCKVECGRSGGNFAIDCRMSFEITDFYDFRPNRGDWVRHIERIPDLVFGTWGTPYWVYGKWGGAAEGTTGNGFENIDKVDP